MNTHQLTESKNMFQQITLSQLEPGLKKFLTAFIVLILAGTTSGILYLHAKTSLSPTGTTSHLRGDEVDHTVSEFDIPASYPKSAENLLLTTHNHFLGFAFLFLLLGGIFYFNSVINGRLKFFIMVEPFISVFLTFSSIWAIRYISPSFTWIIIPAAIMTYASVYLISAVILYDLLWRK